ncbi:sulfite exporter TauE/SafE family protein [Desertihabitans brevis]|uniref:Probable membrane transporter protein n=1 Tax=Desertihabitans brevis TaxID=2268447 RepID=A0A367Z074_9ACTN|nr:sulfite exporter TauE/SafE family protein [Desertihabitans brevis]RCK70662.1 sulfite exporter TauE/SafE family protein [Desertihabitans brevis]
MPVEQLLADLLGRDLTGTDAVLAAAVLLLAAFGVGFAKTAIGGLGTVAVALFAFVLPARESTAALLLVLLVGDVIAVTRYRKHVDWALIRGLLPGLLPGLLVGTGLLALLSDDVVQRGIGIIVLLLVGLQLWLRRRGAAPAEPRPWSWPARLGVGTAAGTTTMVANAGGPVMTLYLLGQGVPKHRFVGTNAWFFFGLNLCKVPFSIGLGLMEPRHVLLALVLAPAVGLGAWLGISVINRIRQQAFELAVLGAAALSAVALVLT